MNRHERKCAARQSTRSERKKPEPNKWQKYHTLSGMKKDKEGNVIWGKRSK